jgi:hypothetical protein
MRVRERFAWGAAAALALFVVAAVAGVVRGGPLDPSGSPGQTMKTLEEPPSWHQSLDAIGGCASERFSCVLAGAAVLDRETGFVWELQPATLAAPVSWFQASNFCQNHQVGSRKGWRLPGLEELLTLVDTSASPSLPAGHPFLSISAMPYWTSTTSLENATDGFTVNFFNGQRSITSKGSVEFGVWCVRGAGGHDGM